MMATVPHVTSGLGLRKFQADGFLLTRVCNIVLDCNANIYHRCGNYMIGDSFLLGEEYYFCQEIEYYPKLWRAWGGVVVKALRY